MTVLAVLCLAALCFFAGAVGGSAGCTGRSDTERRPGPLRIVASVPPLVGLTRALVPESAKVESLIPPGRSEHGFELTPSNIESLANADIVIIVGLNLEPRIEKFLADHPSGRRRVVCFADVVGLKQPEDAGGHDEDGHGDHPADPAHDVHDHGSVDPHLWLDPALVERLIPSIRAAIEGSLKDQGKLDDPEHERLAGAEKRLLERISALDETAAHTLAPYAGRSMVTHHAAWSRLADRYGLKVAAVIRPIETQEPTPAQVAAAIAAVRDQQGGGAGAKAIFVEPQFNPAVAERIAKEAGVRVGTLDPVGDEDWFALMQRNVDAIAANLAD